MTNPWIIRCWYCEREFENEKVLIDHQRARHFKCTKCNKKLSTAGGMAIHLETVHKETLYKVPNALPEREDTVHIEIFGMDGVPEADKLAHEQRVLHGDRPPAKQPNLSSGPPSAMGGYNAPPSQPPPGMMQYPPASMGPPHQMPQMSYPLPPGGPSGMPMMPPPYYGGMPPMGYPPPPFMPQIPQYPQPPVGWMPPARPPFQPPVVSAPTPVASVAAPAVTTSSSTTTPRISQEQSVAEFKLVVEDGDLSLEELRAKLPRYSVQVL
eukprot:Partr_v1_DN28433_c2_g1_i2_m41706 putative zinc finger protein 207